MLIRQDLRKGDVDPVSGEVARISHAASSSFPFHDLGSDTQKTDEQGESEKDGDINEKS